MIGNPPYKVVKSNEQKSYIKLNTISTGELYAYFFEKSIEDFLKNNATISFITGSLFIKGLKFETLRNFLNKNTLLHSLRIEGDNVFESVQMPTATFIANKSKSKTSNWRFEDFNPVNSIIEKIENDSNILSDISVIMRGLEIGRSQVQISGEISIVTGSDVSKWTINKKSYINAETLSKFSKDDFFFNNERILIRETGSSLTVLFLDEKLFNTRSLYSIKIKDNRYRTKYICGLLNSKLMQFYYESKFKNDTDLFPKIRIAQVKQLPVKRSDFESQITEIATKIISLKTKNLLSNFDDLQNELDYYVYKTFQLTDDEILFIDPNYDINNCRKLSL